jgi:hypothetical protein
VSIESLATYKPHIIISFGSQLSPTIEPFQCEQVGGVQVIQSDALETLDDTKKKSLWLALKKGFGL